mmetsp:Transcript_33638/g.61742  ORF Transcript_33638/g.61742 Transcript_33638/m.61742 type:complete len:406 (-) Transcript_33638:90-1307(-)
MTEWWVSQPKHFCKICRVWTGGHRNQILKHEQGIAHIENEAKGIKDARERQKKKDAEEKSVKDQLAEIERKALAAMTGFIAPPTAAATPAVAGHIPNAAEQKRAIIETVEAAKRRRTEGAYVGSWTAHVDPNSKCTYYYNATTKESRWEKPPDFVEPATAAAASGGSQSHTVVDSAASAAATATAAMASTASGAQATPATQQIATQQAVGQHSSVSQQSATPGQGALVQQPASAQATGAGAGSPWVVCTDPTTGHLYYFNKLTMSSTWERPADLGVDLSKPPAPPKKPEPPPRVIGNNSASVGGWEEVRPEDSMWKPDIVEPRNAAGGGRRAAAGPDSDEDEPDPIIQMKYVAMSRGEWMDEDLERHQKPTFEKKSSTGSDGGKVSFPITRQKASGIRKREVAED